VAGAHNLSVRSGFWLLVAVLVLGSCAGTPPTAARDLPPARVVASVAGQEITVNVLELYCHTCAERIVAGCRNIPGVTAVDVDRKEKLLTLHFDSAITTRDKVLAGVDDVVSSIP